jgi:hypothetical protein
LILTTGIYLFSEQIYNRTAQADSSFYLIEDKNERTVKNLDISIDPCKITNLLDHYDLFFDTTKDKPKEHI